MDARKGRRETDPLRTLFGNAVRLSLEDLELAHAGTAEYLTDLLARFAHTEAFLPRGARGGRIETPADVLAEIRDAWTLDGASFDPVRELALRRHLGDFALFVTGFLWEQASAASSRRHLMRLGRWAYRFLAEHARATRAREATVYRRLSNRFESHAGALAYLREVYLDANLAPWPHPRISRKTGAH